jgi:Putative adhesin
MKKTHLIWLFTCCLSVSYSQTTLQVTTKTIEKTIAWKPGYSLEINGEKAEVAVSPGAGNNIVVHVELSTKHPDAATARKELEQWKFVASTVGKKIYLRAYIGITPGKPVPTSNFKARIQVQIPTTCPVTLVNKLGKARLENLNGPMALTGEFCQFELTNLGGEVWLESNYGSVEGRGFKGKLSMKTNRADVTLSDLRDDCSVKSAYGTITVEALSSTGNIAVLGDKSEVHLKIPTDANHNVYLKSGYGDLQAPDRFGLSNPDSHTRQANWQTGTGAPFISIETTFGKIKVE